MKDPHLVQVNNLDDARKEIDRVGASPVSVNIMAPKAVFKVVKVYGLSASAANILKQEMLSKGGEAAVGDQVVNCRQPSTDAVLMGTLAQYRRVIKTLKIQPVGLSDLAQQLEDLLQDL